MSDASPSTVVFPDPIDPEITMTLTDTIRKPSATQRHSTIHRGNMPLTAGSRIGHYEVIAPLGADRERLGRFQREAESSRL